MSLAWVPALALLFVLPGCGKPAAPEPGAIGSVQKEEIPGDHDPADLDAMTAQQWIDRIHVGRTVNPSGEINEHDRSDEFGPGEQVYVSMEVTDAPAGSAVQVSVVDPDTENELWSDTKKVEAGKSHLVFEIDPAKFGSGEYRADVYVGDERVARRDFEINA